MSKSKIKGSNLSPAQIGKIRLRAAITSSFVSMTGVGALNQDQTVKEFENWLDNEIKRYKKKNAFIKAVNKFLAPLDLYLCEKGDEKTPQQELAELWKESGQAIRGNYPRVRIGECGMVVLTDIRRIGNTYIGIDTDGFFHSFDCEEMWRFENGEQAFELFKKRALPKMFKVWMKEYEEREKEMKERLAKGEISSALTEK